MEKARHLERIHRQRDEHLSFERRHVPLVELRQREREMLPHPPPIASEDAIPGMTDERKQGLGGATGQTPARGQRPDGEPGRGLAADPPEKAPSTPGAWGGGSTR